MELVKLQHINENVLILQYFIETIGDPTIYPLTFKLFVSLNHMTSTLLIQITYHTFSLQKIKKIINHCFREKILSKIQIIIVLWISVQKNENSYTKQFAQISNKNFLE